MCGIAGFLTQQRTSAVIDESLLNRMQEKLAHRGPDGYRIWTNQAQGIGVVHRRLSIVDLSNAGFQPMFDAEDSVLVLCNGEIYNHPQLKCELESRGHKYHSSSDTETIIHAYKEWGINGLSFLEGMFACALFDLRSGDFFLIRDRIGIKPIYFSTQGDFFSFASEIKALFELPWIKKAINALGVYHYLTYLATPAPLTIYKEIYKLPAGHYAKIDARGNFTISEWYNPAFSVENQIKTSEHVELIEKLLSTAVESHMLSDVPCGIFLSGGLDSSLNLAYMARNNHVIKSFNVCFSDDGAHSEQVWARKASKFFNSDHHEIVITQKDAFDFYQNMLYQQDDLAADCVSIPIYYLAQLAKKHGVSVVHVGDGADELFCGYRSYLETMQWYNRWWAPSQKHIPSLAKKATNFFAEALLDRKPIRQEPLQHWAQNKFPFWGGVTVFTEGWKKLIFKKQNAYFDPIVEKCLPGFDQSFSSYSVIEYHLKELNKRDPHADFLKQMTYLELKQRLPELLLNRLDKMTMAVSVEGRVPFLDRAIVEYALNYLPSSIKCMNNEPKYPLKKIAERFLPHEMIYRKKMGFSAPLNTWFNAGALFNSYTQELIHSQIDTWEDFFVIDEIRRMLEQHNLHGQQYGVQLWTLSNLMRGTRL